MGFHSKESDNEHLQNIEQPMFVFRHEQFPFSQGVLALKLQHRIFRTSGVITSTPGGSIVGSNNSSASFRSKPNSDSGQPSCSVPYSFPISEKCLIRHWSHCTEVVILVGSWHIVWFQIIHCKCPRFPLSWVGGNEASCGAEDSFALVFGLWSLVFGLWLCFLAQACQDSIIRELSKPRKILCYAMHKTVSLGMFQIVICLQW